MKSFKIIKENGDTVIFCRDKLEISLIKSGAFRPIVKKIVNEIENSLYDGITTKEIYKQAFNLLVKNSKHSASRYNLKKAIMQLGPTGFPFENFVSELLKYQGYNVKVGVFVQGHCVQHEVDVVAEKENKHFMIECKFHSSFKIKCNVKIPLYIQSRFLDVKKQWIKKPGHAHKFHQGWVVNNTRFSKDAIDYAQCIGLKLVGWDYPKNEGLKDLISQLGLYPITCLSSLKKLERLALLKNNIVICKQLCDNSLLLKDLNIENSRFNKILIEAHALCRRNLE